MIDTLRRTLDQAAIVAAAALAASPLTSMGTPAASAMTASHISGSALGIAACSSCWSGYVGRSGSGFTEVTGSWRVPCLGLADEAPTDSVTWVGLGGLGNNNLVQTGTRQSQFLDSNNNVEDSYSAFVENTADPNNPNIRPLDGTQQVNGATVNVSCGDSITATVSANGDMVLKDLTNGESSGTQNFGPLPNTFTADWIVENTGGTYPLADFQTETFTNANAHIQGFISTSNVDQLSPIAETITDWNGAPLDYIASTASNGQFTLGWITSSCEVDPDPNWNCVTGS